MGLGVNRDGHTNDNPGSTAWQAAAIASVCTLMELRLQGGCASAPFFNEYLLLAVAVEQVMTRKSYHRAEDPIASVDPARFQNAQRNGRIR